MAKCILIIHFSCKLESCELVPVFCSVLFWCYTWWAVDKSLPLAVRPAGDAGDLPLVLVLPDAPSSTHSCPGSEWKPSLEISCRTQARFWHPCWSSVGLWAVQGAQCCCVFFWVACSAAELDCLKNTGVVQGVMGWWLCAHPSKWHCGHQSVGFACTGEMTADETLVPSCLLPVPVSLLFMPSGFLYQGTEHMVHPSSSSLLHLAGLVKTGMSQPWRLWGSSRGRVLWLSSARGWEGGLGLRRGPCSFDWQTWMMQREFYSFLLSLEFQETEGENMGLWENTVITGNLVCLYPLEVKFSVWIDSLATLTSFLGGFLYCFLLLLLSLQGFPFLFYSLFHKHEIWRISSLLASWC